MENLDPEDVVFTGQSQMILSQTTYQVSEFKEGLKKLLISANPSLGTAPSTELLNNGIPCKVLKPEQKWRSGKLRLRLEFCPDPLPENTEHHH